MGIMIHVISLQCRMWIFVRIALILTSIHDRSIVIFTAIMHLYRHVTVMFHFQFVKLVGQCCLSPVEKFDIILVD